MGLSINNKNYDFDSIKDVLNYLLKEEYFEDLCEGDEESLKDQLREVKIIVEKFYKDKIIKELVEIEIEDTENITNDEIFQEVLSSTEDFNESCSLP